MIASHSSSSTASPGDEEGEADTEVQCTATDLPSYGSGVSHGGHELKRKRKMTADDVLQLQFETLQLKEAKLKLEIKLLERSKQL